MPFPKWNINTTIQSQALTVCVLCLYVYYLCYNVISEKHPINKLSRNETPKAHQVEYFMHPVIQ